MSHKIAGIDVHKKLVVVVIVRVLCPEIGATRQALLPWINKLDSICPVVGLSEGENLLRFSSEQIDLLVTNWYRAYDVNPQRPVMDNQRKLADRNRPPSSIAAL
jgi:hypothetical protein